MKTFYKNHCKISKLSNGEKEYSLTPYELFIYGKSKVPRYLLSFC